ncbi:dTDP-4-dehydrorhamnose reductase [Shewanella maritima]|uniref:dTDP-4-dehydrorhamnose reductase n=1 Tax=Shewanella maritima TaxID=2520507 RepID=UPI003735CEC9
MKVLVTGKGGQLASELTVTAPEHVNVICLDQIQLDITDETAVINTIAELNPDYVINAAAYTAVDKAEQEQELAFAVNGTSSGYIASACKLHNAKLVHISTDFVFDGTKTSPYTAEDTPNPINVYGASKLAGEELVAEILAEQAVIIRTAWVYSTYGNNFVKTMLRLMAEKPVLGIVSDQVGTPTWAKGLALMIWSLIGKVEKGSEGTNPCLGFASNNQTPIINWTDAGVASWYDFAVAIQEIALEKGLLTQAIPVNPIFASQYPVPAARPAFSVIDKTEAEQLSQYQTVHWRKQLAKMMAEL